MGEQTCAGQAAATTSRAVAVQNGAGLGDSAASSGKAVSGAGSAAEGVGGSCGGGGEHAGPEERDEQEEETGAGDKAAAAAPGGVWRDFMEFSPPGTPALKAARSGPQASAERCGAEAGGADGQGARASNVREDQEEEAEEESLAQLEEAWCSGTEDRYFGVRAQLSALREVTRAQPANVAAWIHLAELFLQGQADLAVRQQLALNALTQGLENVPSSLELWHTYLQVLESQSADEAHEMAEVAVCKVPLALSLWHRLSKLKSSVKARLDVWRRAAEVAKAYLTSWQQGGHVDGGWRQALVTWVQAHVAAAACLVDAGRRHEASLILSSAASHLPPVLTRCLDAMLRDTRGDGGVTNVRRGGESCSEVQRWVAVLELLCVLSAQAATVCGSAPKQSVGEMSRGGRAPSVSSPGMGAAYEMLVSGCCGASPPSILGAERSGGCCAAAGWLQTIADAANAESIGQGGADTSIEAIEHALNVLRSSTEAAAASSRAVGGLWGARLVSPLLARHYLKLMRRARPSRGACTARERIVTDLLRAERMECSGARQKMQSWIGVASVLVTLSRDAVLAELSGTRPDELVDSCAGPEGAGAVGGAENGRASELSHLRKEPQDAVSLEWCADEEGEQRELEGGGGLVRLQALMRKVLEVDARQVSGAEVGPDASSEGWQAAYVAVESGYWAARLDFAAAPSQTPQALHTLRRGLGCAQTWLQVSAGGASSSSDQGATAAGEDPTGNGGAGQRSQRSGGGSVSSSIFGAIQQLLVNHAEEEDAPSGSAGGSSSSAPRLHEHEKGGREEAKGPDGGGGAGVRSGGREHVPEQEAILYDAAIRLDRAQEGLVYWLCRSYVLAAMLELREQSRPEVSAGEQQQQEQQQQQQVGMTTEFPALDLLKKVGFPATVTVCSNCCLQERVGVPARGRKREPHADDGDEGMIA